MSKFDLMNDDEVIKYMKRKISIICIGIVTIVLLLYSRVVNALDENLLKYFSIIAIIVYIISILSIKFFLNKIIFNIDNKRKSQIARSVRDKYKK